MKSNYYINQWTKFINESTVDAVLADQDHIDETTQFESTEYERNMQRIADDIKSSTLCSYAVVKLAKILQQKVISYNPGLYTRDLGLEIQLNGNRVSTSWTSYDDPMKKLGFRTEGEEIHFLRTMFCGRDIIDELKAEIKNNISVKDDTTGYINKGTYTAGAETDRGNLQIKITVKKPIEFNFPNIEEYVQGIMSDF